MKIKSLILIAFAAIITLSFSFAATSRSAKVITSEPTTAQPTEEPIRGFIAEDKF